MPCAADRPTMPWCSTRAQLAHRPEDLDAQHQDDQQRGQRHRAGLDATARRDQRRRRAAGDRDVGDAARQRVGAEHPHGAAEQVARLDLELVGARLALAERLQRGQALDRNRGTRRRSSHRPSGGDSELATSILCHSAGANSATSAKPSMHQRDRQVDEGDDDEDQQRRQQRDQELRQELAEIGLELLDAVDHRQGERRPSAGGRPCPVRGGDLVVQRCAAAASAPARRSRARPRRASARATPRSTITSGDQQRPARRGRGASAGEDLADQPAQQAEPGDAEADRAEGRARRRRRCAAADAFGEDEQTRFDVHGGKTRPNIPIRQSTIRKNPCTYL